MNKILLIGAGGHCKSCIDVIEQQGLYQIAGIIDKEVANETTVLGYPVIGSDESLADLRQKYDYALVTIGQVKTPELKVKLFSRLVALGYNIPTIISPLAYVSKHAKIGRGTIVMHHALVNAGAGIGENCIINSKALVEHDVQVGNNCHISTGAVINGNVKVSDHSFIGSQATTKQGVVILEKSFIKAGSVVK
jgi:sugar O-acyltransferase (sialic acid O-acetyltransferase NeuD family)